MKERSIKSAFFASLILLSLTCFVYVNITPIEGTTGVYVETITQKAQSDEEKAEKSSKMPDLVLLKSVLTICQKFLPAK